MLRRCSFRRSRRGQRFDALAALGRQQPDTVIPERSDPVGMPQNRRHLGGVGPEAFLRAAPIVKIHPIPLEGSNLHCYQTTIASGKAESLNGLGVLRLSRISRQRLSCVRSVAKTDRAELWIFVARPRRR